MPAATRERIALAVAEINGCGYCLAAHSYIAAVRDAGYDEAQILEIVLHVALNTLTNYVNEVARTEIDFPAVSAARAA